MPRGNRGPALALALLNPKWCLPRWSTGPGRFEQLRRPGARARSSPTRL